MPQTIRVRTRRKREVVDVIPHVMAVVDEARVWDGIRLFLGTWQGWCWGECDGPRAREIVVDASG